MRIVAGAWAGRDLTSPRDARVRPTAEPVRAALLDLLHAEVKDARVLDLFAGTGALGLEALSRGARTCDFVEMRPSSLHALKANIGICRVKARTRVFVKDAVRFAEALPADAYDLAFADPPYESGQLDWVVKLWQKTPFAPVLAVEHATSHVIPPGGTRRRFDDATSVTIYRRAGTAGARRG